MKDTVTLGFIGQGWIGKNYADSFEERGFEVIRYSNERSYSANRDAIKDCDFVFIAVPTPTTPKGIDDSIVREVLPIVGKGKTAVIKSTVPLGATKTMQAANSSIVVISNPEFLREAHARHDVDNPTRTIIGVSEESGRHHAEAKRLADILPKAPYTLITDSTTAEFIKYTHNTMGYSMVLFTNILFELATAYGVSWDSVKESIVNNPWIPEKYLEPVHKGGRGAGGSCFIKDFAAFRELYEKMTKDEKGLALLKAYEQKNIDLLRSTGKDIELLKGVYGDAVANKV
jgi:UDPglucose 6-dehydrogenase